MSDAKAWKDKYQRVLEELEHLKSDWEIERGVLQRGIAKMAIAAQGFDQQLDDIVVDLRKYARGSKPSDMQALEGTIQNLEKALESIDERRLERHTHMIHSVQQLVGNLRPQIRDENNLKKITNLEAHIERAVKQSLEPDITRWLKLLANMPLNSADSTEKENSSTKNIRAKRTEKETKDTAEKVVAVSSLSAKSKLLGKIFGSLGGSGGGEASSTAQSDQGNEPTKHQDQEIEVRLRAEIEETRHALKSFLMVLEPTGEVGTMVSELEEKLSSEINLQEIPEIISSLSDITLSVNRSMGEEFSEFLLHIEKSLDGIGKALGCTQDSRSSTGSKSLQVDADIRKQMEDLSKNVEQASELAPLKKAVKSNIRTIFHQLDEFKRLNQIQDQSLATQLKELVDKVARMENESEKIEEQLTQHLERSYLDQLTQVPNRAAYETRLEDEFQRWKRYGHPLSLMVCDVDYFKKINDTYGHLAGDKVLKVLGTNLAKSFRKTDFVARYGGEEFVILLPETTMDAAIEKAEEIRRMVAALAFHFKDQDVNITASLGVSAFSKDDVPSQVFERADQALYKAKGAGRNRVESS